MTDYKRKNLSKSAIKQRFCGSILAERSKLPFYTLLFASKFDFKNSEESVVNTQSTLMGALFWDELTKKMPMN